MALLGMQVDMPCKRHFPGCNTSWDLNLNASGSVPPSNNADRMLMTRQYSNGAMLSPSSDLNLWYEYNKNHLLKQTMLKQDAIFRDQVCQLHQLYRRHKELMDEMERDGLQKHHQDLDSSQPNNFFHQSFGYVQQERCHTSGMRSMNQLPSSYSDNYKLPLRSVEGKHMQAGCHPAPVEASFRRSKLLEYKCKKFGKMILDLELPGSEYIDSEGEELNAIKVGDATKVPTDPLKNIYSSGQNCAKEQSKCNLNCDTWGVNAAANSITTKANFLADLNVPLTLEEEMTSESGDISTGLCEGDSRNNLNSFPQDLCMVKSSTFVESPGLSGKKLHSDKTLKFIAEDASSLQPHDASFFQPPTISDFLNYSKDAYSVPKQHTSMNCVKASPDIGETNGVPDLNLKCDFKRFQGCIATIDLNSCIDGEEDLRLPSCSIEIDLEAPASPDIEESLPPRGVSDGNQVETLSPSSGLEDVNAPEELVKIAAEVIVSISSFSATEICSGNNSSKHYKAYQNVDSLNWFARVASSVVDDSNSDFGIKANVNDNCDQGCLSYEIDYFEAMTLQLVEIKADKVYLEEMTMKLKKKKGGDREKEETNASSSSLFHHRRGRTRRGRQLQKDFQREILPSLASLSRYEVTKDIQLFGGLIEATSGHWQCGSSRTKGRYGGRRGRQQLYAGSSYKMESNGDAEVGMEDRRPIDWGKITKRPRRSRVPSSNPWLISSRA